MSTQGTVGLDAARLIQAAHDLGPTILALRDDIDRERRLPGPLVEALRDGGFFSLWLAKEFGGPELNLPDFVRVVEALAQYDGSVAWCVSNAGTYSIFSGFLPVSIARRIFVDERAAVVGSLVPCGKAEIADGGFRVTGRWAYGSGIMHGDWVLGACTVHDGSGPRHGKDGAAEIMVAFFPARDVKVIDTWNVGGLRGTGSHDYEVADVFVPAAHVSTAPATECAGALYRLPFFTLAPAVIGAVPLGIARGALDVLLGLSNVRTPLLGSGVLSERPVAQAAIGRTEAMLCAARSFALEACEDAWQSVADGAAPTVAQRARVRLAFAQVAEMAKTVTQTTYDLGGGTAVYEDCPLQRCFRDAHAAAQHVQIQSGNFETVGRVLLGLEPGTGVF